MSGNRPHDSLPNPGIDPERWDAFVGDLGGLAETPSGAVASAHIAAAVGAAQVEASPGHHPARAASPRPLLRRRTVFTGLFTTIIAKVIAGTMAIAAATAGAAAAGVLPDPVQGYMDDHVFHRQAQVREVEQTQQSGNELAQYIDRVAERIREQVREQAEVG
ncbi:MAG: hypothetical protein ABIJ75_02240, partial [Actinomycetota bacterium]